MIVTTAFFVLKMLGINVLEWLWIIGAIILDISWISLLGDVLE